MDWIIYCYISR